MIKQIIGDRKILSKACQQVTKDDKVKEIVQDLKDTLGSKKTGWGLSANQIGVDKRISYIRLPKHLSKNQEGWVLINAVITEKDNPIRINDEGCLSFPGIKVTTKRHLFLAVEYLDEKLEQRTAIFENYEALAVAHEIDHNNGITIFNRKWIAK